MRRIFLIGCLGLLAGCASQSTPATPNLNAATPALRPQTSAPAPTSTTLPEPLLVPGRISPPAVCSRITPPAPAGSLSPAPIEIRAAGLTAEWFIAPGAFNMPEDTFITPDGEIFVFAVRGNTLYRVAEDGNISTVASKVQGYLGDMDARGDIYLHMHPDGSITRITPQGGKTILVDSNPDLRTDCDSGFGFGPDGNLYLALSHCSDKATLFRITTEGGVTRLAEDIPQLQVLRTTPDGRFVGASWNEVYEISPADFTMKPIARIPTELGVSPGGLAADAEGHLYLSTGSRRSSGELFRVEANGAVTLLAAIPQNGLSGIAWNPKTGEVIGGQIRQGGLIAVSPDGVVRELMPGNGLVTPMGLAMSPCGELAVNNDDGGMMSLVDPGGGASWFFDYISFVPPVSFVAFAPDGTLYTSEAAPGLFPVRVAVLPPGAGQLRTFADADMPSGLARRRNGALIVSETRAGRVTEIHPDGSRTILAEGLTFPQALALDRDENVYVAAASDKMDPGGGRMPMAGDRIFKITSDGVIQQIAAPGWVSALAVSPAGDLIATTQTSVVRVLPNGRLEPLADGFAFPMGLAFDLAGNLYVSDARQNAIIRIGGFPQSLLRGYVTDQAGKPVPGATIRVTSENPIVAGLLLTTDPLGHFEIPVAPLGYTVEVWADGYHRISIDREAIPAGATVELMLTLDRT